MNSWPFQSHPFHWLGGVFFVRSKTPATVPSSKLAISMAHPLMSGTDYGKQTDRSHLYGLRLSVNGRRAGCAKKEVTKLPNAVEWYMLSIPRFLPFQAPGRTRVRSDMHISGSTSDVRP